MASVTVSQIEQYAYNAGFRGQDLITAVAIALAESGPGNASRPLVASTTAYNPETAAKTPLGSGSRGLWQIWGKGHPEYNNNSLYDPQTNANAAYSLYKAAGNRFTPWTTYIPLKQGDTPRYLQFVPAATAAVNGMQGQNTQPPSSTSGGVSSPLDPILKGILTSGGTQAANGIAAGQQGLVAGGVAAANGIAGASDPITGIMNFLTLNIERVAFFVIGILLIIVGVVLVTFNPSSHTVTDAIKAVGVAAA